MPYAPLLACPCGFRRKAGEPCERCGGGKRAPARAGGWVSDRRYCSRRWRKIAAEQLAAEPLCAECHKQGKVTAATVCDHVVPHRGNDEAFWYGERQSLCASCHGTKSASERLCDGDRGEPKV
jgi:HNH endonuclease